MHRIVMILLMILLRSHLIVVTILVVLILVWVALFGVWRGVRRVLLGLIRLLIHLVLLLILEILFFNFEIQKGIIIRCLLLRHSIAGSLVERLRLRLLLIGLLLHIVVILDVCLLMQN